VCPRKSRDGTLFRIRTRNLLTFRPY